MATTLALTLTTDTAEVAETGAGDGTLNCHGYGSSVTVTATFGMVAAGQAIASLLAPAVADPREAQEKRDII